MMSSYTKLTDFTGLLLSRFSPSFLQPRFLSFFMTEQTESIEHGIYENMETLVKFKNLSLLVTLKDYFVHCLASKQCYLYYSNKAPVSYLAV